jgi:MarR family transcriptional regulator, organic hydroperoxide resistance regulator
MSTYYEYTKKSFGNKVNRAARLITQRLGRNFKENNMDITPEQWSLLLNLWREDGQPQNTLAVSSGKDEPCVSRIINTMEKHNLVRRTPHPKDRRANLIFLTEEGKTFKEPLMQMGQKTNLDATEGIDPSDLEICLRVLDKVIKNLS